MTKLVEGVLTIVEGFSDRDRAAFVRELAARAVLTHDEQDILTIESRRGRKTGPLERVVAEMKRRGKLD